MDEKLINQTELAKMLGVSISTIARYREKFQYFLGTFSQPMGNSVLFNELEVDAMTYAKHRMSGTVFMLDAVKKAIKKFYDIDVQDVSCENCAMLESEIAYKDEVIRQQHALLSTLTTGSIK
ncbi:helix-turn-helix transcriptional regulator [Lysinibacillus sphaericus]|uniref:helix-turn-helix transcriptional regulator n=1 Tax=Lysinibacillus sphaericus TaxID=1421 RepID=UPI001C5EA025